MKKYLIILTTFLFAFLFLPVKDASAKVIVKEKGSVTIDKDEIVDDDLFIGAETVEIYGIVNGDVYVGTGSLRVEGLINGNLHAGSGMTILGGSVTGSAYIGTGNLTVNNAQIGNSLLVGAGNVSIDEDSSIGGSLLMGSGTALVDSPVGRNVFLGAGSVDLNSEVGGEARIAAGVINLGPSTKIEKDLYYAMDDAEGVLNISDSASISGMIKKVEQKYASQKDIETTRKGAAAFLNTISGVSKLISLAGALIVGYIALKMFGKFFTGSGTTLESSFWKSLGIGFLVIVLAFPALILLAITGVGLSLSWIAFLLLLLGMYFSKIVVAICFGNWIVKKLNWDKSSTYKVFAIGLFGIYILKFIPIVGFFTSLVVLFSGLGALVLQSKTLTSSK